jgi:hypothetical protein
MTESHDAAAEMRDTVSGGEPSRMILTKTERDIEDVDLIGAEVVFGTTPIGHVVGVLRDPISHRVRRLLTSYGPDGRRVAVPMEWVIRRTPSQVVLGVDARSLDDLADQRELGPLRLPN